MNQILNTITNINYLKQDFVGFHFNINLFPNILINFVIASAFIVIFYLVGNKVRTRLLKGTKPISAVFLIDIGLGYVIVASGIALLGFFSLLTPFIIVIYLAAFAAIVIFPSSQTRQIPNYLYHSLKTTISELRLNKFLFIWLSLFILLAGINLINPEIREDQYHVDLAHLYISYHTIMIPPKEQIKVSGSPLLAEMSYIPAVLLGSNETARYLHFMFYLLVLLELFYIARGKDYKFAVFAPVLFASAPVVIHETSSAYVDFQWIFCFLLSIMLITFPTKKNYTSIGLAGFFLGGMIATKLWTIVFVPIVLLYIIYTLRKTSFGQVTKHCCVFIFPALVVSGLWFFRAFLLTGNPVFPAFSLNPNLSFSQSLPSYLELNSSLLNPLTQLNSFSPLFFIGALLLLYKLKDNIKVLSKINLSVFIVLLFLLYFFINYPFGRYLLGLYIFLILIASLGLSTFLSKFRYSIYLFNLIILLVFGYYFVNSVLVLPYTLGFANENKYLTRILSRDDSSYYDFDKQFNKYIGKNDFVGTYGIFGHFYANFNYVDINYLLEPKMNSFTNLEKAGITKLLVKGGNINWFCKQVSIQDCNTGKYKYISHFSAVPYAATQYYLYTLK